MENSFQFIDIIFFAMIAIFLILRLRGALGKRDGNDGPGLFDFFNQDLNKVKPDQENEASNVVKLSEETQTTEKIAKSARIQDGTEAQVTKNENDDPLAFGISQVQVIDTNFDEEDFIVGAHVAFEMILRAFASAGLSDLKVLVSDEVYSNFAKAIQERVQAGHVMEDTLVGIMKSEMVEAYTEGSNANITIKFVSEQVNALRDENGDVVEGNANVVLTVTDFWTFARDTKNSDPNWLLVATRSLE